MLFEEALKEQVEFLKEDLKNRKGVTQGFLVRNSEGDVIDRVGRISENPSWYREFYSVHKKVPTQKDLVTIATKQLQEGYWDYYGFIPPLDARL